MSGDSCSDGRRPLPLALWVIPVSDIAGVARHVLGVAAHGIPGWRLVVLCPEGPLAARLREIGSAVLTGPIGPSDTFAAGVRAVRRAVETMRPAVTHSHLSYADLLTAIATIGTPTRLVTTEHGIAGNDLVYHGTYWRSRLKAAAHTLRLRRFDAMICVSQATLRTVRQKWHPARSLRSTVIPNGVDPLKNAASRRPGLHVISLSRLAPEKGLRDLLEAFALVLADHPEARLTIAGDGPLRTTLIQQATRLHLSHAVSFPGFVDAALLLSQGDVLVQLSLWENCSYSILDALAHRLGVVATPVGGNPELLPLGSMVDRKNHRAVADAIITQGLRTAQRPALPPDWYSVPDMTSAMTRLYAATLSPRTAVNTDSRDAATTLEARSSKGQCCIWQQDTISGRHWFERLLWPRR